MKSGQPIYLIAVLHKLLCQRDRELFIVVEFESRRIVLASVSVVQRRRMRDVVVLVEEPASSEKGIDRSLEHFKLSRLSSGLRSTLYQRTKKKCLAGAAPRSRRRSPRNCIGRTRNSRAEGEFRWLVWFSPEIIFQGVKLQQKEVQKMEFLLFTTKMGITVKGFIPWWLLWECHLRQSKGKKTWSRFHLRWKSLRFHLPPQQRLRRCSSSLGLVELEP